MTPDGWRKIDRGLFESADGQWRIANPWRLTTELRHRWLLAERRCSGSGWCMHDGDHATLHDACAYIEAHSGRDLTAHTLASPYEGHAAYLRVRPRRTLIASSAEPVEAVQCSSTGPSGCEPRSGVLDRLERRSYAVATTASWSCSLLAGRAAAAGPEGSVSP